MPNIPKFFRKASHETKQEDLQAINDNKWMLRGALGVLILRSAANLEIGWSLLYATLYLGSEFIARETYPLYLKRNQFTQEIKTKFKHYMHQVDEHIKETQQFKR